VLAYLVALVPALTMAITQPVWSLVDEAQHFDFIVQLSHGRYPAVGSIPITPETLQVTQATGVYRAFYPAGTYPVPDLTDVSRPPDGISDRANAVWMQRHMWQLTHETVQTPIYYVAMVPVWWAADGLGGPFAAIYVLRVINALIVATLAPMAVALARLLAPARLEIAVLAATLAIFMPGLDLNGTRISNDALAAAAGGAVVLLSVRWAQTGWSWRRALLAGLLFGAAMMVKITDGGLFPALALSMLWPAPGTTGRGRFSRLALASVIAVTCLGPWFLANLRNYGTVVPGALVARWSDALPGPLTASFAVLDQAVFVLTYWTGEPWGALPLAAVFAFVGLLITLTVPVAVIRMLRGPGLPVVRGPFLIATAAVLGMYAVSLLLTVSARFEFVGPGRYVYPALPAITALGALGIWAVTKKPLAQRIVGVAYAGLATLVLGLAAAGLPSPPAPGTGSPPPDAQVVSVNATGQFRGMSILVDRVAFDSAGEATWFEITATNASAGEVEWTVAPVASTGTSAATGEYLKSSHIPGDLEPGQAVTGWLRVSLEPAAVRASRSVNLRFSDIAFDGYRILGNIDLDVQLPGLS
jgi:4-amino-4-deoxy-L-arabinose transferase-like glycosyltransferase